MTIRKLTSRSVRPGVHVEVVGFEARQSLRRGEITRLRDAERDRVLNMTPFQREAYNYQQELKLRGAR